MKFGHFDDQNKEYVITSPRTPLPWINYLGCENFFSLVSNTCGATASIRMQSFCVSPDTATTTCHTTATDTTTI